MDHTEEKNKLGAFPFVIGGIAYIPLLGIPFAVTAIIWGLVSKKTGRRKLVAVGTGGILFTIVLYGSLFYFGFVQTGGIYDELRLGLAQTQLNVLVPAIELYKIQYGSYPASLETLQKTFQKDNIISVYDPSTIGIDKQQYFFYEKVGEDHYYLRAIGPDGIPFTSDDVVPKISVVPNSKLGLLIEVPDR